MKKILAIMLIAVIAVAGVFATNYPEPNAPTSIVMKYKVKNYFKPGYAFQFTDGDDSDGVTIGDHASIASTVSSEGVQSFDLTPTDHNSDNPKDSTDGIVAAKVILSIYDRSISNSYLDNANQVTISLDKPSTWVWARTGTPISGEAVSTISMSALSASTGATKINTTAYGNVFKVKYEAGSVTNSTSTDTTATTKIGSVEISWTSANVAPGSFTATLPITYTVI